MYIHTKKNYRLQLEERIYTLLLNTIKLHYGKAHARTHEAFDTEHIRTAL